MPANVESSPRKTREFRKNWFQLPAEFFQLPFMEKLEEYSTGNDPQKILIRLFCFCLAGSPLERDVGKLRLDRETPYDEAILARRLHVSLNDLRVAMKIFHELGLIKSDSNGTLLVGWIGEHVKSRPVSKSGIKVANWRQQKKLDLDRVSLKPSRNPSETLQAALEVKRVFPPLRGENTRSDDPESETVVEELELLLDHIRNKKQGRDLGRLENP